MHTTTQTEHPFRSYSSTDSEVIRAGVPTAIRAVSSDARRAARNGSESVPAFVVIHSFSAEAALDGIYVIRTSVPVPRLAADDVVRSYKMLSQVERAFRSLKTIDLEVRPIRHRLEDRVKAHIFLCMLAHYSGVAHD